MNKKLTTENSHKEYLERLISLGLIDKKNRITTRFIGFMSAFVTMPLYNKLTRALNPPFDIIALRDMLDMCIVKNDEHAVYMWFKLIYSFTRLPMPQELEIFAKNGMIVDFAAIFLMDFSGIIQEDFEIAEV